MTKSGFEIFHLNGFEWNDLLDFLFIPHYSNDHEAPQEPRSYDIRTLTIPDETDEDFTDEVNVLVLWTHERPSDEEVVAAIVAEETYSEEE